MLRVLTRLTTTTAPSTVAPLSLVLRLRRTMSSSSRVVVPGPVVTVAWLKANYPQVRVVDASWYMPNEARDPRAEFEKARLPGSVFFDLEACTSKEGANAALPHMLPSAQQMATYMGELGLKRDDAIVVYDGKGIFSAPRVRLTMQHFGADNVALLDGGIKAWTAAGEPTESGPPPAPTPVKFEAREPPAGFVRDMATVRANSTAGSSAEFTLVDARSKGRFEGVDPEPRPDLPSGHIAGALSVPFMNLFSVTPSGGTAMKSAEELKQVFSAAGVDVDSSKPLVGSCGSGVTACVVLLGLELTGRTKNVGLYDGSWTEWALNKDNPIVTNKK